MSEHDASHGRKSIAGYVFPSALVKVNSSKRKRLPASVVGSRSGSIAVVARLGGRLACAAKYSGLECVSRLRWVAQ